MEAHDGGNMILFPASKIGIAVGKGSTSVDALKWALANENLQVGDTVHLLHVYPPVRWVIGPLGDRVRAEHASAAALKKFQDERAKKLEKLISRYRSLCHEKKLKTEVHYGESDAVQKELVELISTIGLTRLVLGASKKNVLSRAFKGESIATHVVKHVPNFCTVIVICKGKIISASDASSSQMSDTNSTMSELSRCEDNFMGMHYSGAINSDSSLYSSMHSVRNDPDWISNPPQMRRVYGRLESTHVPLIPNSRPQIDKSIDVTENVKYQDIYEASSVHNGRGDSVQNDPQRLTYKPFPSENQSSILDTCIDEDSLVHEVQALQNQLDQAKFSIHRAKLEAEQHEKDISHADTIVSNAKRMIVESERQRHDALKEAKAAKLQSLEDTRRRQEAIAALETVLQEKEILKKNCESRINALTSMINNYKTDLALAREQVEEERKRNEDLEKKLQELSSDLEKESSRRKQAEERALKESFMKEEALAALRRAQRKYTVYTFRELEIATDNFQEENRLGEGGYGPVFKGKLLHTPVAIKVLTREGIHGWEEFQREVELLSNMHHPHLVMLLGACPERGCIVYEYMSNGSLEDRLICKGGSPPLPWYIRFRICSEVATALLFLHSRPVPVVHRDLKPGNILLDHNYVSKIGDVGIAKLVANPALNMTMYKESTMLKGTMAYMDPEYQRTGIVNCQSDVYALGIVMLRLLTGFPAFGVTYIVENALEKNELHEVLDREAGDWPFEAATILAKLSLQCAEPKKRDRPDLESEVLPVLENLRAFGDQAASKTASS